MQSLPANFRALVIGTGAIGSAIAQRLTDDPGCAEAMLLGRRSTPAIDYDSPETVAEAARALAPAGPFHLIVCATGALHLEARAAPASAQASARTAPEKRLDQLEADTLARAFAVNTIGPALVLRHFEALLAPKERSLFAFLSARVGSIGDNKTGGWYSYRASKAALNMLVKTAAIEIARKRPLAVVAALHPGTVVSPLTRPVIGDRAATAPADAATNLLEVLDALAPDDSGGFRAWDGSVVPW